MKNRYSLKSKILFQKVLDQGKRNYTNHLSVFFLPSKTTKIGISIPRKSGNAVLRNKNKRQIKNIINDFSKIDQLQKNIVIIVKKSFCELSFSEKQTKILDTLNKLIKP